MDNCQLAAAAGVDVLALELLEALELDSDLLESDFFSEELDDSEPAAEPFDVLLADSRLSVR